MKYACALEHFKHCMKTGWTLEAAWNDSVLSYNLSTTESKQLRKYAGLPS